MSHSMITRLAPAPITGRSLAVLLLAAALGSLPAMRGMAQDFVVVEILAPLGFEAPEEEDDDLAHEVLQHLDADHELSMANFAVRRKSSGPDPLEMAQALVKLASPEEINSSQSVNNQIRLSPVKDFDAFCKAIDYGRVLEQDAGKRYVKVRIAKGQLNKENLVKRARATGRGRAIADLFEDEDEPSRSHTSLLDKQSGLMSGEDYSPGDEVELRVGQHTFAATVGADENDDNPEVLIKDMEALTAAVKDKRLRYRLSRVRELSLFAPPGALRFVSAGAASSANRQERLWRDASGKFSISATFVGLEGEKVELLKSDGKTIKAPLSKLCDEDQAYVAMIQSGDDQADENPFQEEPAPAVARGLHRRVDRSGVQEIGGDGFDRWAFAPEVPELPQRASVAAASFDLAKLPNSNEFFEEVENLVVSASGSAALITRKAGEVAGDDRRYLQMVSAKRDKVTPLIDLPGQSKLLDSLQSRGLVLMRPDVFGNNKNTRIFVQRVTSSGLEPVTQWDPYLTSSDKQVRFFAGIEEGYFLAGGRVLTKSSGGGTWTIWKLIDDKAVAEYEFKTGHVEQVKVAISPGRRYLAMAASGGISLFDTVTGKHVGTLPGEKDPYNRLAFSPDLTRLAAVSRAGLTTWDLKTGERVRDVWHAKIQSDASVAWAGDFVLVDSQYLFDPHRRILLWRYKPTGWGHDTQSTVQAGRLWFVPKAEEGLPSYLGTTPIPHDEAIALAESLGSPESLLLAQPGDRVAIEVDVDPQHAAERDVRAALTERLTAAGYQVVDDAPLVAVATCKALPRQEIKINMSKSRLDPDAWDIVTRTIVPHISRVALKLDGEEIWARGSVATVHHNIWIERGETLDQALERLTTPNVDAVLETSFASFIARQGDANDEGAYGESKLTPGGMEP